MANILEVIIKSIFQGQGTQQAQSSLEKLSGVTTGLNKVLGLVGLGVTTAEAAQFVNTSQELARAQNDARNALTRLVGSADAYTGAIQQVREATRGTLSETEAAQTAFGLLDNKIAKTTEEAAQYALAGKALNAALGPTASYEKFLMLLDEGSPMLMNNFNITQSMVDAQQKLVEANTNLTGSQARLQAIREVALQKGLALADSLSKETIQAQQAAAAQADFGASFGQLALSIDQSFGVTQKAVAMFQTLTDGAKAWGVTLNQYIPAIQQHNASLAQQAAQQALNATSQAELDAAWQAGRSDFDAFTSALLAGAGSVEQYNSIIERGAQGNYYLVDSLTRTSEEFNAARTATDQAAAAGRNAIPVFRQINDTLASTPSTATASAQAINDLASSYDSMTNRERSAMASMALARGKTPELLAAYSRDEASRKSAEAEQEQSKQSARSMTTAFTKAADDIGNIISGKLQTTFQEVFKLPEGSTEHADEPARRLATVAAAGFSSEWLNQLNQQFAGQSFWAPIAAAMQGGNQAELQAAATTALQQFSQGLIPQLWNVEQIRNQIRTEMQAKRIKEQLTEEIKQQLGAEGISQSIGVVEMAAGNVTAAQATVQASTDTMSTSAVTAGTNIKGAFDAALPSVDALNNRFKLMAGLIERVDTLAKSASGNIAGMNPPANGAPSDADTKMGGDAVL